MEKKKEFMDKLDATWTTTMENIIMITIIVVTVFFHVVFTMIFHLVS